MISYNKIILIRYLQLKLFCINHNIKIDKTSIIKNIFENILHHFFPIKDPSILSFQAFPDPITNIGSPKIIFAKLMKITPNKPEHLRLVSFSKRFFYFLLFKI